MGQFFARTSIRASVIPKEGSATMVYTSVPKFCEVAGLVGCLTTGHTTVETLDGAPVMKRWHHQEKTITAIGTNPMATAWR